VLFPDADKTGYIDYLNKLLPLVKPGGEILVHNTGGPARPMHIHLQTISDNPRLKTIFLHIEDHGVGIMLKKRTLKVRKTNAPPKIKQSPVGRC
jgi:caffeoyl-CoA O-methyltransferase